MGRRENDSVLKLYEIETEVILGPGERLFRIAALCSFLLFGAAGLYLKTHNPPPQVMEEKAERRRQVSFVMEERKKPLAPAPVKKIEPIKKAPEPKKEEPIDLTKNPVLNQKVEDVKPEPPPKPEAEQVRRVYGLRKVYSTGLGAGADGSEAVIGKQGNTLNADIDTLTATDRELKGAVAPVTQISHGAKIKKIVKPEYTDEMKEAGIQGTIWAEIVVDTSGIVRDVKILNDLGYGSKELARKAFLQCVFEPARYADGRPAATKMKVPMKFVLLDE